MEMDRDIQREIFHLLVHVLHACNSQAEAMSKSGNRNSIQVS